VLVDDGSTDQTAKIARSFTSKGVKLISSENRGLSAGQNLAYRHSEGDYLQFLDADDLLAPDKIETQLARLTPKDGKDVLLSSPWAPFFYRTRNARFVKNSLWQDLLPVDWLLRKMGEGIHMQNATWLVSRELVEAAGPWNEGLLYDQDGEFFTRVLVASKGTRFVPGTGIFYRSSGLGSISYIGNSDRKRESLLYSMKVHIQCLRSLEESERVRQACLAYLQIWYPFFYPRRHDLVVELQALAAELNGTLQEPRLRWKYSWMKPLLGWNAATWAQSALPQLKSSCLRQYDKMLYHLESPRQLGVQRH
jgi:glycosyltransferase involved in cell wall biosynthesis